MSSLVSEAATLEFGAQIPWPTEVKLYQPYEGFREVDNLSISQEELPEVFPVVGQILLADFASCLAVKTYLRMAGVPYTMQLRTNAEFMSPTGKVPFIQVGPMLISEFDPIISFVGSKGAQLSAGLNEQQRADMRAYMALVTRVLHNAELYISWIDKETLNKVTKQRYGSPFPWPLNRVLPWLKQRTMQSSLTTVKWAHKTREQVCEEIKNCCQALSEKLGDQEFFLGDKPTELDALVYGHLFTLLTTHLPIKSLPPLIQSFPNLADFCRRIDEDYFRETELPLNS